MSESLLRRAAEALYYVAECGDPKTFYRERYIALAEELQEAAEKLSEKPVLFPEPLLQNVEEFIKEAPDLAFNDVSEFIRSAVRNHLRQMKKLKAILERIPE